MKKNNKEKIKNIAVKAAEKSFIDLADLFSGMICLGRTYEPKMPEKLKK